MQSSCGGGDDGASKEVKWSAGSRDSDVREVPGAKTNRALWAILRILVLVLQIRQKH